jgi:hypothetical protein
MVLGYDARQSIKISTRCLPPEARVVRAWATIIAHENGWPEDWLNDAAKVYLTGISNGPVLFEAPGIEVRQPAIEQLLAMKLCAWRDSSYQLEQLLFIYSRRWSGNGQGIYR